MESLKYLNKLINLDSLKKGDWIFYVNPLGDNLIYTVFDKYDYNLYQYEFYMTYNDFKIKYHEKRKGNIKLVVAAISNEDLMNLIFDNKIKKKRLLNEYLAVNYNKVHFKFINEEWFEQYSKKIIRFRKPIVDNKDVYFKEIELAKESKNKNKDVVGKYGVYENKKLYNAKIAYLMKNLNGVSLKRLSSLGILEIKDLVAHSRNTIIKDLGFGKREYSLLVKYLKSHDLGFEGIYNYDENLF